MKRTKEQIAILILESAKKVDQLKALTDHQISQLLIEHVWSEYHVFSLKSDLIQEAARRLEK